MSSYPNILTPPSSNEDSPQPIYYVASPNSNSFQEPEVYAEQSLMEYSVTPKAEIIVVPSMNNTFPRASLHLLEQPTDRFRFRYKSEMAGTHGSLTGYTSDKSRKQTYPTVELHNCTGPAVIRCSIYQLNEKGNDMKPHAHRLIMKRGKDELDDPHDLVVGPEDGWKAVFHGMGIIHTAKKNIVGELEKKKKKLMKEYIARTEGAERELRIKEKVEIKGLAESESKSINLNIVCLRFDAFIKQNGILYPICDPIYSHGINNLKSALTGDLKIVRLDHVVCEAKGNKEVYLLVERVTKKNIKIRFFETDDEDRVVWEAYGKFNDLDVHHQYAIVFRTPMYRDQNITKPVKVFLELVRPSDSARSEPRDFRYIPNKKQPKPGQKRARYDYSSSSYDSSNLASDELPVVINNLNLEPAANVVANFNVPSGLNLSEDLIKAMNNISSEEFQTLYNELGSDYQNLFATDSPKLNGKYLHSRRIRVQDGTNKCITRVPIKMEVSQEDKSLAIKVLEELKSFSKTKYNPTATIEILNHYLGEEMTTNALHICICQNDVNAVRFILKMIIQHRKLNLINIQNSDTKTYLHLAVMCHNDEIVRDLLLSKAKISAVDYELNTALHIAVQTNAPVKILGMLLSNRESESVNDYIDKINTDGNTALMLAIENKNLHALKLLCTMKADVNMIHSKDGFVPLRLAIEKEYLDGIKYLLSLPQIDATIKDFRGVSPILASIQKDQSGEIYRVVNEYKIRSHIEIEVKEEAEEETDEEMEDEPDIKPVIPLSETELKDLYEKHDNFTPHCLDEVSAILDASGKWEHLAELLDIRHLIDNVISSKNNVSKAMLTLAIETNNDKLWNIRNLLESLDELKAVEIMDRMVQNLN